MAGTVTLMFTDLVGSTELLGRLGEDGAAELRRRHFAALRDSIAEAGGREVKSLGDGLMVAFESAREAVACARDIQRRAAGEDSSVGIRVGLHAGEPDQEGDDFFGMPVVVASRLCDKAGAGQILASDLVRGLAGSREKAAFKRIGQVALKGISEPVATWEVTWGGEATAAVTLQGIHPPLPKPLAEADTAFVGRGEAIRELLGIFEQVRREGLRIAMLSGEPGIGKTRLAAEAARKLHEAGATVLFGRCDEEGLIPYQPFAEALRGFLAEVPEAASLATGLERIIGVVEAGGRRESDPSAERLQLFEGVADYLSTVGASGPLVVVLDDLHWADGPTLALLRHLARRASNVPALIVGTYRETDLSRTHPLSSTLSELRREHAVARVSVQGLGVEDVASLLTSVAGHDAPTEFVRALHAETEGNPFFIEEIVRHLVETGTIVRREGMWTSDRRIEDMGIPEGVREAVGRRLARLSEDANRALADAAVLGRNFEFDVLAAMSGLDEDALLDGLDEALAAQLVVEVSGQGSAAYSFRHALVRETLYEELSLPRRQRLHLRAAEAIEQVHARGLDPHAGTLALHLRQAGAAADPRRALEWTLRAAQDSADRLAWEEAATLLETALELMDESGARPEERGPLLERLADLRYITSVDLAAGIACLEEALECYEASDQPHRVARIHSRLGRDKATYWGPTMDLPGALEHIAAARSLFGTESSPEVASLELALATAALWQVDAHRARPASRRALQIAREVNRPLLELNAEIIDSWMAGVQGEAGAYQRLDVAWLQADRLNHPWLAFLATWSGCGLAFWKHGPSDNDRWLERERASVRTSTALGQLRLLEVFRAQSAAHRGRLEESAAVVAASPYAEFELTEAMVTVARVDPEKARSLGEQICVKTDAIDNRWARMLTEIWVLAEAARARGDVEESLRLGEGAVAGLANGGWDGFADCERGPLAWRHALAGNLGVARAHVEAARPRLSAEPEEWPIAAARLAVAEGALAAADGRVDEATECFARGIKGLEEGGGHWMAAEARRAWGLLLRDVRPIDEAIAAYEDMGAARDWLALAHAERGQVG